MPFNAKAATYMRFANDPAFVAGLQELIAELPGGLTMVEVGVFAGESTRLFVGSGKVKQLFAVDPWQDYSQDDGPWSCPVPWADVRDTFLAYAVERREIAALCRPSLEAVTLFADGAFDFVYLDGNHAYEAIRADIAAWRRKVRPCGWLGGHDHGPAYPGVARAVAEAQLGQVRLFRDTSWLVQMPFALTPRFYQSESANIRVRTSG